MPAWLPVGVALHWSSQSSLTRVGAQRAFIGPEVGSAHGGPGSRYPAAHVAPDIHILEEELVIEAALAETQVTRFLEIKHLFGF